jgi:hypothetical protein
MTLDRITATGSSNIRVRITIEGIRLQIVSDPEMAFAEFSESDPASFVRVHCLRYEDIGGIVIDEQVNLPEAKLEAQGASLTLFETKNEDLSQTFFFRPDVERDLAATLEAADEIATLLSTDGILDGDVVHIGTEACYVDGVESSTELNLERGYFGSTAQKHWANEGNIPYRLVTNRPMKIRGRRARIYLYEDGDDPQGDGTQIWLGQVETDPSCDDAGLKWRLQLGSIAKRLDGKVGGDLEEPLTPRGASYTLGAPLLIHLGEVTSLGVRKMATGQFLGFYETQRDFIEALNLFLVDVAASAIDLDTSSSAPLTNTYRAVEDPYGRWTLQVHVLSGSLESVMVRLRSEQDGVTDSNHFYDQNGMMLPNHGVVSGEVLDVVWTEEVADSRLVPRGFFGFSQRYGFTATTGHGLSTTTYPHNHTLYLSGLVSDGWTSPTIEWPDGSTHTHPVREVDTAENWIRVDNRVNTSVAGVYWSVRYGAGSIAKISATRQLAVGSLADLRDGIVAEGTEYANRGTAPFLTSTDLADWSAVVTQLGDRSPLFIREWSLGTSVEVGELLSHEWRLQGVFPVIESDGSIGIRELKLPNVTTADATVIDEEIVSAGWSSLARGNQAINRVELKTGYDAREDEWTGTTYNPTDMSVYGFDHIDRPLTIEPRSSSPHEARVTPDEIANIAIPVLTLFGSPHAFVDVNVSWKLFGVLLGETVLFSAEHLPDFATGLRPIADMVGTVVGRRWQLGEAHGRLRIYLSFLNIAGYSPTARVLSRSAVSGNTWDVTVNHTMYAPLSPAGSVEANTDTFFAVGDKVRVVKFDNETSAQVAGTVSAINTTTHVIRVAFDAVWTIGSDTWELMFAKSDVVVDSQTLYAYIQGTGNAGNPRRFAG